MYTSLHMGRTRLTLRRPKKVKTNYFVVFDSVKWSLKQIKSCKSTWVKNAKMIREFSSARFANAPQRLNLSKLWCKSTSWSWGCKNHWRVFIMQLRFASGQSAWTFHFSSFESLMSLPYLIKAMKDSQNLFKTFVKLYKNPSVSNTLVAANSVRLSRSGSEIKLYPTWEDCKF